MTDRTAAYYRGLSHGVGRLADTLGRLLIHSVDFARLAGRRPTDGRRTAVLTAAARASAPAAPSPASWPPTRCTRSPRRAGAAGSLFCTSHPTAYPCSPTGARVCSARDPFRWTDSAPVACARVLAWSHPTRLPRHPPPRDLDELVRDFVREESRASTSTIDGSRIAGDAVILEVHEIRPAISVRRRVLARIRKNTRPARGAGSTGSAQRLRRSLASPPRR